MHECGDVSYRSVVAAVRYRSALGLIRYVNVKIHFKNFHLCITTMEVLFRHDYDEYSIKLT